MKTTTNWKNIKSFLLTFPSFIIFFIFLVLYFDSKIILRNQYEETNNKVYLILLFIVMVLRWNYIRYF